MPVSKIKIPGRVKKFKAVIIGAGRIGSSFDTPAMPAVMTHAHAFHIHPQTELVGFFDVDKTKAQAAARKWSAAAFTSLVDMLKTVDPDIVSVCTPAVDHYSTLLKLLQFQPRLVLCEKP